MLMHNDSASCMNEMTSLISELKSEELSRQKPLSKMYLLTLDFPGETCTSNTSFKHFAISASAELNESVDLQTVKDPVITQIVATCPSPTLTCVKRSYRKDSLASFCLSVSNPLVRLLTADLYCPSSLSSLYTGRYLQGLNLQVKVSY